jgi:hypothetical protein
LRRRRQIRQPNGAEDQQQDASDRRSATIQRCSLPKDAGAPPDQAGEQQNPIAARPSATTWTDPFGQPRFNR